MKKEEMNRSTAERFDRIIEEEMPTPDSGYFIEILPEAYLDARLRATAVIAEITPQVTSEERVQLLTTFYVRWHEEIKKILDEI